MQFGNVAVALLLLHHLHTSASADFFSPFISPSSNGSCNDAICGQGTCKSSNKTFLGLFSSYYCECNPGWTKFSNDDTIPFLPCVIPNCTMNYSCSNETSAPAPASPPISDNGSILDPCTLAICGDGECVKTSSISVRCDCKPGSSNLLNNTNFPCFRECSLGANCDELGINWPTPFSPPSTTPNNGSPDPSAGVTICGRKYLMWVLMIYLILEGAIGLHMQ